jgi:hypothetical protein
MIQRPNTPTSQPNLNELSNCLMNKASKFEDDNYQSGFAKPSYLIEELSFLTMKLPRNT